MSNKNKLSAKAGQDLTPSSATDMDPAVSALENTMKQLAIKRQKGAHILKLTSWALYRRYELKGLIQSIPLFNDNRSGLKHVIESITSLIDNLEKFFPHLKLKPRLYDKKRQKPATRNLLSWL